MEEEEELMDPVPVEEEEELMDSEKEEELMATELIKEEELKLLPIYTLPRMLRLASNCIQ